MALSKKRKIEIKQKLKKQRIRNIKKGLGFLSAIFIVCYAIYAYFFIIFDPVKVKGYVFENYLISVGPRDHQMTINYEYSYQGKTYIKRKTFHMWNNVKKGDSIYINISKSDPDRHEIIAPFFNDILNERYNQKQ